MGQDAKFVFRDWQNKSQPKYNRICWILGICKCSTIFHLGIDFLWKECREFVVFKDQMSYELGFALGIEAASS